LQTICLGWPQTVILPKSPPQITRICCLGWSWTHDTPAFISWVLELHG
jgi:hypothetical protein